LSFPGSRICSSDTKANATGQGVDPLGYGFAPFGYAAGQVLAKAVEETKSTDQDKLAAYIHGNTFQTVVGDVTFGKDGEWAKSRQLFTQFQNVRTQ
jgi:branched-chain amino acid transport system substrate-binding protein